MRQRRRRVYTIGVGNARIPRKWQLIYLAVLEGLGLLVELIQLKENLRVARQRQATSRTMHPSVRGFSERRPRLYGLLILAVAIALGFVGQSVTAAGIAFLVLMLAAGFGVGGIYYLTLGRRPIAGT